jgi:hypothetical protein
MTGLQTVVADQSFSCVNGNSCAFELAAACPSGTTVVGGGASSRFGGAFLYLSGPANESGVTNNSWYGIWHVRSDAGDGNSYEYYLVAYCATSAP